MSHQNKLIKLNPFDGRLLYEVPKTSVLDLVQKIQTAQKQFHDWKDQSLNQRKEWLHKIKHQYILNKNQIIQSESLDQGLSIKFTEKANYNVGLKLIENIEKEIEESLSHSDENKIFTPVGVISIILSWNLSNRLFIEKVLPAVLAGNTVLVKVSSVGLAVVETWETLLKQISFPSSVIQFIISDEIDVKNLIVTHPGIKAVSITGKLETCSTIFKKHSELSRQQFKKLQMFSGSKNSAIVLKEPSDDLVDEVMQSFLVGQGQLFWNSSRLFVLEKFQKSWIDAIQYFFNDLNPAKDIYDNSYWSPLIKNSFKNNYQNIFKQAQEDHAKFITTANSGSEVFLKPIFTYDMSNCSELQQDELSLPMYVLSSVKYGFDIPKYANVSYYGGPTSIWWDQPSSKIVSQLETGLVSVNQWSVFLTDQVKHVKQSSYGLQDNRIFGTFYSNVKILS